MSDQPKFIPFINEISKLSLYSPTITAIEAVSPSGTNYPQQFKLAYSQVNYREAAAYKNTIHFSFDPTQQTPINQFPVFSNVENDVQADVISPSRQLRALFRKSSDKTTLEIWTRTGLWKSIRISDLHEPIYGDPTFCITPIVWSQNEKRIAYIAENKEEKAEKYFEDLDDDEQTQRTFDRYLYKQELGEGYRGKKQPIVFIYDLEEENLYQLLNIPKDITPAFVNFRDKEGTSVIFAGIDITEIKLGLKVCANRLSQIYYAQSLVLQKVEKKNSGKRSTKEEEANKKQEKTKQLEEAQQKLAVKLNDDAISLAPTFSQDLNKIAFFFSPWKITHSMGFGIKVIKFNTEGNPEKQVETILDVVQERRKAEEFPGIMGFHDILTKASWYGDRYLVFNTYAGCSLALYIVDTVTKELQRLDKPQSRSEEWRLRAVFDSLLLITISNINTPNRAAIYYGANQKGENLSKALKDAKWHTFDLAIKGFDGVVLNQLESRSSVEEKILEVKNIDSLFFGLKETAAEGENLPPMNQRPLVVFLHGGPHVVYTGAFSISKHYLLNKGYNILFPSFTGSLGYGQKFLEDLAGKIGEIDVDEIIGTLDYCISEGLCDKNKVAIYGGSYGGFLCGALLAKHAERFNSAVIINPAVNATNLWEGSDIPDWSTCETLNKDTVFDVSADEVKKMYEMSPVSMYKGKDVKSSILLVLGEKDRRVPYGGGLQYYNLLKMKGADVRLLTYADSDHSIIGNPEVEFDLFLQTLNFFNDKLKN